jgi:hypothetical protein
MLIDVFAHQLHFVGDERRLRRLMQAPAYRDRRVAKRASQRMQTIERSFMELQDRSVPQLKWPLLVLHMSSDDLDREIELSETVLGLSARNLDWVA